MNAAVVEIASMSKAFGSQQVLHALDWTIGPGSTIGLLGRNGAGKTTLLECLLGLREVDAGRIRIFEGPVDPLSAESRARIGYVPQQSDLFEWLTPVQMLDYFRALYPRWNVAKVDALLDRWAIDCGKPIGKLSGGEKQRLSIIRALAHDPELLILDEPVSSLDPAGRRDFLRELIDRTIERDATVVFSTHILSDLERVALDVAFLKDGRILLQSPLDDLLESARRITGPAEALAGLRMAGEISRTYERGIVTSVITRVDPDEAARLQLAPSSLRVEPVSFEDLFVEVTR